MQQLPESKKKCLESAVVAKEKRCSEAMVAAGEKKGLKCTEARRAGWLPKSKKYLEGICNNLLWRAKKLALD